MTFTLDLKYYILGINCCGTRIMVIPQSSKLKPGVRFPCTAFYFFVLFKAQKMVVESFSLGGTSIIAHITLFILPAKWYPSSSLHHIVKQCVWRAILISINSFILHISFTKSKEVNSFTLLSLFQKSDDIINFIDERGTSLCYHFACKVRKWKN